MVEYFTKDHWNVLLSGNCRAELLNKNVDDLYQLTNIDKPYNGDIHSASEDEKKFVVNDLQQYISAAHDSHLTSQNMLTPIKDILATLNKKQEATQTVQINSKEYMSGKKSHEVEKMSSVVDILAQHCNTHQVLDIGSGKGYLSTHLSLKYGMKVTAIDCNDDNTTGASQRAEKFLSYWRKHLNGRHTKESGAAAAVINNDSLKLESVTAYVAASTDPSKFLPQSCEHNIEDACIVTGLHTCGDLCSTVISMFVTNKLIKGLCVVGCCYHLISESNNETGTFPMSDFLATKSFSLGRNKRMLALKAPERHAVMNPKQQREKSERSLFYRAVLSVILKEKYGLKSDSKDACIGKIFSKSHSFLDYIRRSLNKLRLDSSLLSDEEIDNYLQSYEPRFKELVAFSMIRHQYGPAVESIIVLDKYLYLLEQVKNTGIEKCFIGEVFDPILSPRCFALIASKSIT
uniref:Protein RRNAD1-like n=1 Tax=Phallusia mammillata TaxID=59560 RepID=A0A6F9DQS8_9ASCI|nr:protein RRNAD1-like [Phallusia mammillata]